MVVGKHPNECGCADCLRSRTYNKRVWTHRMMLESKLHEENSFLTLTYNDESLPVDGSLVPKHVTDWLKRFRSAIEPVKVRYFLVGEYGDVSHRPHYHAALFGVGPQYEDIVRDTWQMGHVMLGDLNIQSIRYICGYVTKKMTSVKDLRLEGRFPEFTRMSRRPGIGFGFAKHVVDALDCDAAAALLNDDVPGVLEISGRKMPLGRNLRNKIREEVYVKDSSKQLARILGAEAIYNARKELASHNKRMSALYEDYENSTASTKMSFLEWLKATRDQKDQNFMSQFNLNKKGDL